MKIRLKINKEKFKEKLGVKDGQDGKDADEQKIISEVLSKIPKTPEPKLPEPDTPEIIRDKLQTLKGEDRLDKSAIKGLEEEFSRIRSGMGKGARLGMKKIQYVRPINLTDQVDGIVNTFNLPRDTVRVLGVFGTQFPINFNADVDWTFSGQTLTLVTTQVGVPQSGQTLWALVETLFYA